MEREQHWAEREAEPDEVPLKASLSLTGDLGLRRPSRIALSWGRGAGIYASVYNQSLHVGCFEKET